MTAKGTITLFQEDLECMIRDMFHFRIDRTKSTWREDSLGKVYVEIETQDQFNYKSFLDYLKSLNNPQPNSSPNSGV